MLYLAEIQKKTGIMGGRSELKLLACQRSEQSWNAVPGDELIPLSAEQANNYNAGALVLVDLTSNKQIQRFQEAGRQLVNILQNFSKLQERVRVQEDEIEQWKASLTFQSQELQRREIEMESRQEQIQNMDADLAAFQEQREALEQARAEVQQLQSDLESNRQNLDGAWAHLKGEQERLEELQTEVQSHASGLSAEQTHVLKNCLDQFGTIIEPIGSLPESLQNLMQEISAQQSTIHHYQQKLDHTAQMAEQFQAQAANQAQELANRKAEMENLQRSLDENTIELTEKQQSYKVAQALHGELNAALQRQDELRQQICEAVGLSDSTGDDSKVDLRALEKLSTEELEGIVANLQRELTKVSSFVNDQEEELRYQQQTIDELQAKIEQASEYDRLRLGTELADENDRYRLLDETLIGQRRSLRERENVLNAHLLVIQRRCQPESTSTDELQGLLNQWCDHRRRQVQHIQQIEAQLHELPVLIEQLASTLNDQTLSQVTLQQDILDLEQALQSRQIESAVHEQQVQNMRELLQQLQNQLDQMQNNLNHVNQVVGETQSRKEQHRELVSSVQNSLNGAMN